MGCLALYLLWVLSSGLEIDGPIGVLIIPFSMLLVCILLFLLVFGIIRWLILRHSKITRIVGVKRVSELITLILSLLGLLIWCSDWLLGVLVFDESFPTWSEVGFGFLSSLIYFVCIWFIYGMIRWFLIWPTLWVADGFRGTQKHCKRQGDIRVGKLTVWANIRHLSHVPRLTSYDVKTRTCGE